MSLGAVLTPIVTPFDDRLEVDEQAFVDLMHYLAARGSDGFVVCATTGESATLTNDEHLRVVELALQNRPTGTTIVASTGSNNTRQAAWMTAQATELGADAILSVTPYYNKPTRCGIVAHYREVASATDRPVILYNVPSRVVLDLSNELLAELAQIEHIDYVKQSNNDNLALVDGLGLYAGNDDAFARTLDLGGSGGILVSSHLVAPRLRQMVDQPEHRWEINAELEELYRAMFMTTNPIPVKTALNMLGHRVGGLRLPLVEPDDAEIATIRSALADAGLFTEAAV